MQHFFIDSKPESSIKDTTIDSILELAFKVQILYISAAYFSFFTRAIKLLIYKHFIHFQKTQINGFACNWDLFYLPLHRIRLLFSSSRNNSIAGN